MNRPVRLLLVTPPYHAGVVESAGVWMNLGYAYLAGHARAAGAEVVIYDAMSLQHGHEQIAARIEEVRPDIVGVGAITAMEPDAREICQTAKRIDPSIMTVLGGVHPTFCWRDLLTNDASVDIVVCGEGEETIADLVRARANGGDIGKIAGIAYRDHGMPRKTRPRRFSRDLDSLVAAWDLIDWPSYYYRPSPEGRFGIVSSSRGCQHACSFCSQQKFWEQTWRARDAAAFVDELEFLRDTYDVRVVMFSDETPTVSRRRWETILELLIERKVGTEILMETRVDDILRDADIMDKYAAAGISHIYVGVEAVDQETLDLYNKETKVAQSKQAIDLINEHGMISETSFVLGGPNETVESVARTLELAKWYAPDMAFFLAITPWPYADIYPDLAPHIATHDFRKYNLVEPVIKPKHLSLFEMNLELMKATGHFFHDKFEHLDDLAPHKREYMVDVLRLLIEHSYLGKEMAAMASHADMPPAVKRMLKELNIQFPAAAS